VRTFGRIQFYLKSGRPAAEELHLVNQLGEDDNHHEHGEDAEILHRTQRKWDQHYLKIPDKLKLLILQINVEMTLYIQHIYIVVIIEKAHPVYRNTSSCTYNL
jgi:hypothetical protein